MNNEDEFYEVLGSQIRKARLAINLTQEQLADLLSLNRTSITNIEKGKQKILAHTLVDLAENLKTSISDLLPKSKPKINTISTNNLLPENSSPEEREFLERVLKQTQKGQKDNAS